MVLSDFQFEFFFVEAEAIDKVLDYLVPNADQILEKFFDGFVIELWLGEQGPSGLDLFDDQRPSFGLKGIPDIMAPVFHICRIPFLLFEVVVDEVGVDEVPRLPFDQRVVPDTDNVDLLLRSELEHFGFVQGEKCAEPHDWNDQSQFILDIDSIESFVLTLLGYFECE